MRNRQPRKKRTEPIEELIRILDEEQKCVPSERVVATRDGIRLDIMTADTSKNLSLMLLFVFGPAVALLFDGPVTLVSALNSALWVAVIGGSFLGFSMGKVAARIDKEAGTMQVRSTNPLLRFLSDRAVLGIRYPWARDYALSGMEKIRVESKYVTRFIDYYRIEFLPREGRPVPIADLNDERLANRLAELLHQITGVPR